MKRLFEEKKVDKPIVHLVVLLCIILASFSIGRYSRNRNTTDSTLQSVFHDQIEDTDDLEDTVFTDEAVIWEATHSLYGDTDQIFPIGEEAAKELPDELVAEPGLYSVAGQTYDMTKDGLYRFAFDDETITQTVIWGGADLDCLMSALCWLHTHGWDDDNKSADELIEIAIHNKLYCTCGTIVNFAIEILSRQNIESRLVAGWTLEEWNGYNDGHVLIEAYWAGEWILYDIDGNSKPQIDGNNCCIASLSDIVDDTEAYELKYLATDPSFSEGRDSQFAKWVILEDQISGEKNQKKWYKRVLQTPLIQNVETGVMWCRDQKLLDMLSEKYGEGISDGYELLNNQEFGRLY